MIASFDFPTFFACVAGLAVALYVTLDGFDLGVGILFPFAPRSVDRDVMMRSLEPVWDGNETWLVLGGMVLLSAFPLAFSILLPAFYVPLVLMLLGLVLRGVAFEFRSQHGPMEAIWSGIFAGGSMLAAFCQGAILGAYVDGHIAVAAGRFVGGPFDWLGLFPVATGLGVMAGYAVLGAAWLIWRSDADTGVFAREIARPALLVTAAAILLVSLWTPFRSPAVAARWLAWPSFAYLAPLPVLAAAAWITAWTSLWGRREWLPLAATVSLFLFSLVGLAVSVWPAAIPGVMTIWQSSSALRTQQIVAGGIVIIVPIVLSYVWLSYWVFRGKVTQNENGY